jgi:hypothetical protein
MTTLLTFFVWCLLCALCWPLALLALVVAPLVWLVAWPFRLAGAVPGGLLAFIRALCFLPARLLGSRA